MVTLLALALSFAQAEEKPDLKKLLTPLQYKCTQESGTEKPFDNLYWNNHEDGIYVDVVSGEPLFSSLDKYDSGSGWPAFTKPIDDGELVTKEDTSAGMTRTEVRSKKAGSHLGHVFDDGPGPTRKRFCINSASLNFIPLAKLKEKGLERYLWDFVDKKKWDIATLAGGCFWGMEKLLQEIPGVIETRVGYTGGHLDNPKYEDTHDSKSGHAESVQILFDPAKLKYEQLLLTFFTMHDPTTLNQQGNDKGTQYRSAIFFRGEAQKASAEKIKAKVDKSGKLKKPVTTEIAPLGKFWLAEDYHQKYLKKHPGGYTCHYFRKIKFD